MQAIAGTHGPSNSVPSNPAAAASSCIPHTLPITQYLLPDHYDLCLTSRNILDISLRPSLYKHRWQIHDREGRA